MANDGGGLFQPVSSALRMFDWIGILKTPHANWTDDQLYNMAKPETTAEYQNIKTSAWRVVCFLNFSLAIGVALADAPLHPGGQIEMKLSGVPSAEISAVSSVYTVDGDGSVNLPHIGRLG